MNGFVDSFTTNQLLPPWKSSAMRTWAFAIEVEPQCFAGYLDTHLNAPGPDQAPYYYTPIEGQCTGLLHVHDHPRFASRYIPPGTSAASHRPKTIEHKEIFWSFPVQRHSMTADGILHDPQLVWIRPFYFDDSSTAMFSSREVWGGEKQMGSITIHEGETSDNFHIDLAVQGFKRFDPKEKSHSIAVAHIRTTPLGEQATANEVIFGPDSQYEFSDILLGSLPSAVVRGKGGLLAAARRAQERLKAPVELEVNTLKQFRDVFDMRRAVYRAIIATKVQHSNIRDLKFYLGEQVAIDFMWSSSMAEQLDFLFGIKSPLADDGKAPDTIETGHGGEGLRNDDSTEDWEMPRMPVDVKFAMSFTSDADFRVDRTLHTYGQSAAPSG